MSARPTDTPDPPEPPLVESTRAWLAESRLGQWAGRHKTLAATLVAVLVAIKSWRWLVVIAFQHLDWVLDHWYVPAALTVVIALGAFASVRWGIEWLGSDEQEAAEGATVRPHAAQDEHLERAKVHVLTHR